MAARDMRAHDTPMAKYIYIARLLSDMGEDKETEFSAYYEENKK